MLAATAPPKGSIFAIYLTERSTTLMLSWVRILAKTKPRLETLPTMSIVRSGRHRQNPQVHDSYYYNVSSDRQLLTIFSTFAALRQHPIEHHTKISRVTTTITDLNTIFNY